MTLQTDSPAGTDLKLDDLLRLMCEKGASDLHLAVGSVPHNRVDGRLVPLDDSLPVLDQAMMEKILFPRLDADQLEKLQKHRELDFSVSVPGLSRFRGNILWQRGTLGSVFRAIPSRPLTLEELKLPPIITELCNKPRGLVLVTGPTGSGKSTTLAAMIDHINSHHEGHIVTIEDPIEFLHKNKKCIVRQRELHADTMSFSNALKHVLRQDPDVILVGEMRDLETIGLAVTAAETGHLVFGTLHTTSAATTVDRIIDVFPSGQQQQIRMQLSSTLQGVVSQTLIPLAQGKGRCCAMEIMVGTNGVRNLIREGKTHQINNQIQSGMSVGMQSLNHALKLLVQSGQITAEAALMKSNAPDELRGFLGMPMTNL